IPHVFHENAEYWLVWPPNFQLNGIDGGNSLVAIWSGPANILVFKLLTCRKHQRWLDFKVETHFGLAKSIRRFCELLCEHYPHGAHPNDLPVQVRKHATEFPQRTSRLRLFKTRFLRNP